MIFPLSGLLFGAVFGALRAKAKGGEGKDMLQWGAVFAIIFALLALFLAIVLQRTFG